MISDELLSAYVDNELDPEDQVRVAMAVAKDPELANKVAELTALKAAVRETFEPMLPSGMDVYARAMPPSRDGHRWSTWTVCAVAAAAAGMALLICMGVQT